MKFNIAICDDNPIELNEEKELIENEIAKCGLKYEMDIFEDASKLLESGKEYEFVFLDVEMEKMNGIKTAAKIHEVNNKCLIFFVTNHEDYMDEALNRHAFRFWTKPINKTRLSYGIKSAINEINSRRKFLKVNVEKKKHIYC